MSDGKLDAERGGIVAGQLQELPICELMGEYVPNKRLIRIYNVGIEHTMQRLGRSSPLTPHEFRGGARADHPPP